ncbi:monosaccharide ABC transporter substrate-binding protein, CUT2 family [Rhizobiales bacterium GAS191]|nr:monosaccharide ABC transporter substrate-binding protein, CUT2 family [Rhizobiales bacterium GAS113]SED66750.1 monosaccharide ABC transporter substrate-binding protein, CUT2 family [Rhizobiales bacterium GAS191]
MRYAAPIAATALAIMALGPGATANAAEKWWPAKIYDLDSGAAKVSEYSPLEKAAKPWNVCVLFPHMKDTFWVAVDYGVVEEAKRMGVNMTLYEAGGYENLPKQLSQFDDCMAGNFDAIIVGPISEAGLDKKILEGVAAGKAIISTVNPVSKSNVTSKMTVDFDTMGEQTGTYLVDYLKDKSAKVGTFPGPAGSGWAEDFLKGFKKSVTGKSNIAMLGDKFGDSGVAVQLGLIQNALQAYPDMNVIWGCAPAAEAAVGAVAQAGRKGALIMSSYENQAMLDSLKKGEIMGFATQYPVLQGRIAIDTAVRVLEKKTYVKSAKAIPDMIAKDNIEKINISLVLAPSDFKAVFSVKAP